MSKKKKNKSTSKRLQALEGEVERLNKKVEKIEHANNQIEEDRIILGIKESCWKNISIAILVLFFAGVIIGFLLWKIKCPWYFNKCVLFITKTLFLFANNALVPFAVFFISTKLFEKKPPESKSLIVIYTAISLLLIAMYAGFDYKPFEYMSRSIFLTFTLSVLKYYFEHNKKTE